VAPEGTAHCAELLELGDALLELDAGWRVVGVNANHERLFRRPRAETMGRPCWEAWPETADVHGPHWAEYHRCMRERVPVQFEAAHPPLALWLVVTAYPTSSGGMVVFFRDATAQRRAEEALRQSEARARASEEHLQRMLRYAAAGTFEVDLVTGALAWSGESQALHGLAPAEPPSLERWQQVVHPDDLPGALEALRLAVEGRTPEYRAEFRVLHPEHGTRWIMGIGQVERGQGVEPLRLLGLNFDVTARNVAAAALRESEQRFRILVDHAADAFFLHDFEGRLRDVNRRACESLSYTRDELLGMTVLDIEQDFDLAAAQAAWAHVQVGQHFALQGRHRRKDGSTFPVEVSAACLAVRGERLLFGLARDITDRVRAQDELRAADRRKTEFLGVLSHELRNPLAPIRNSIYLLERLPAASDEAARARGVIRRQTEHLTRLVDDLLDVTRIAHGKIALQRARVDLREIVRRTTDDLSSVFAAAGVGLRVERLARPAWVDADATRLGQVVGNLLHNAVKFTPAGGEVRVRLTAGDGRAELTVRDTGAGIDAATLDRMFEPFAQADRTLARTQGGLGLGLALVKGLVELHGGTVEARSDGLGRGAELSVRLPLASAPVEAVGAPRPGPAGARAVLVVEDNLDAGQSLADILRLKGHRVRVARDGRTGLALARELRPDVVLCDIGLPDLDGYEVARALRADPASAGLRLVALSGYAQPEDRLRAREAGFDLHLAKPADLDELLHAVMDPDTAPVR
jgi:PAS domain S-box-containing protein